MGLGSWPIALVLWSAGALLIAFTRQGISRDNRISVALGILFALFGFAVLLDSPIFLVFLICLPLGLGMIWAGVMPILDAVNYSIPVEGVFRGYSPEIEAKGSGKQVLTFSYTIDDAHLSGTSVDSFTLTEIERSFSVNKPTKIWVSKNDLQSCKVHRYQNMILAPFALFMGVISILLPFSWLGLL